MSFRWQSLWHHWELFDGRTGSAHKKAGRVHWGTGKSADAGRNGAKGTTTMEKKEKQQFKEAPKHQLKDELF